MGEIFAKTLVVLVAIVALMFASEVVYFFVGWAFSDGGRFSVLNVKNNYHLANALNCLAVLLLGAKFARFVFIKQNQRIFLGKLNLLYVFCLNFIILSLSGSIFGLWFFGIEDGNFFALLMMIFICVIFFVSFLNIKIRFGKIYMFLQI